MRCSGWFSHILYSNMHTLRFFGKYTAAMLDCIKKHQHIVKFCLRDYFMYQLWHHSPVKMIFGLKSKQCGKKLQHSVL